MRPERQLWEGAPNSEKKGGAPRKSQGIGTGYGELLLRARQSCHEADTFPGDVGIYVWLNFSLETVRQVESVSLGVDTPQQREACTSRVWGSQLSGEKILAILRFTASLSRSQGQRTLGNM